MARRRAQWQAYQNRIDPSRLVFIDETWTKTNMAPLRGFSSRDSMHRRSSGLAGKARAQTNTCGLTTGTANLAIL